MKQYNLASPAVRAGVRSDFGLRVLYRDLVSSMVSRRRKA